MDPQIGTFLFCLKEYNYFGPMVLIIGPVWLYLKGNKVMVWPFLLQQN
jgi:hypothetical protein